MSGPSRRNFLGRGVGGLLVLLAADGCQKPGKPLSCASTAGLSPDEQAVRTTLGYVDLSPEAGKDCIACHQFEPSPQGAYRSCGSCKLMKGPIHPKGYCRGFAPKA